MDVEIALDSVRGESHGIAHTQASLVSHSNRDAHGATHKVVDHLGDNEDGNQSDESKPEAAVGHGNGTSYADKAKNNDKARGRTSLHEDPDELNEIQQDGWT